MGRFSTRARGKKKSVLVGAGPARKGRGACLGAHQGRLVEAKEAIRAFPDSGDQVPVGGRKSYGRTKSVLTCLGPTALQRRDVAPQKTWDAAPKNQIVEASRTDHRPRSWPPCNGRHAAGPTRHNPSAATVKCEPCGLMQNWPMESVTGKSRGNGPRSVSAGRKPSYTVSKKPERNPVTCGSRKPWALLRSKSVDNTTENSI